jgi:hypothetical protein
MFNAGEKKWNKLDMIWSKNGQGTTKITTSKANWASVRSRAT